VRQRVIMKETLMAKQIVRHWHLGRAIQMVIGFHSDFVKPKVRVRPMGIEMRRVRHFD